MNSEPRIVFVVDALPSIGGGEKTLFAALECFPHADVFTLIYNKDAFINTPLENRNVVTSYLDKFPLARKHHRLLLPLMPRAVERFDLSGYDIVVSFHYAVANGANAHGARHLSYTYTPMRYAWNNVGIGGRDARNNVLLNRYFHSFRQWDKTAASRVHEFAAISRGIATRIQFAYQREAQVIYPPVEVERFHPDEKRGDYFVTLSRLVAHKRLDLVVEAFSRLNLPLKIIGDGPERNKLQGNAAANIEFLGFQSDECVAEILGKARGFVCAAEEDFGIAIVEAQAAGCPVIAYGKGGALETVLDRVTGILFEEQSTAGLMQAVNAFEKSVGNFRLDDITANAQRFDKAHFKREFQAWVKSVV